jgi:hypothetical protein
MIKVYQIQLTDSEITVSNAGGSSPKLKAYFDRSFDSMFKAENFEHYTHVANVYTDDMEDAFRLMNLWEGSDNIVEKLGRCSSMSVGDILVMEDGSKFRCASFGFTAL